MAAPVLIIDGDDDEFDWEAAVQEIDVACQKAGESASFALSLQPPPSARAENKGFSTEPCGQLNGLHKKSRQSTLDQFINRVSDPNLNGHIYQDKESEVEANDEADVKGCCVDIDPEAAKTWIYPENVPIREYQLAISKKALFANTMVALPTGLGKTLIAAVVMYNYFRWFPEGKIVFAAPSRPLVMQQIEACHNIVGIPQEWTIDMTGQTTPAKRECLWKEKRVFFVTPQVFEKDIQSGSCLVQNLVCLVIDEAHRATGNYSYCVAVRELMAVPVQLRILALTATPGSKQQAIQQVIDNLQISTLQYRTESDPDVAPYVHNRKLDLFEVPMGKDALDVNNLLLDVMRPIAARLISMGVLPNRDFQTLSPCDVLTSREKFRQAPPRTLHHVKSGEVEGWLSVLISLYHIRKLLSSHGIRPAYEMLEEKLKQGLGDLGIFVFERVENFKDTRSFARQMNKNEGLQQMKVLMRRSMSNGAPSPKLSKLKEVLVDHFNNNNPESSRVIIFSNFRGSVRDIMDALSNLGNFVKPTEFIGQSSGKTSKGQTQKVQQAVLEKFRKGGYNVIVATCIGEEGLDIMEVDLVICFDANISPLRMIQRMGRTGRKHDGRVVIIVCEGSEMKGYMRKQATGKAVKKHMRNGGMDSFNFHPSPRMVPHIYRPEQKCLHIPIPEYVPRGKNVKDDSDPVLKFEEKLTDAEALTLARYFSNKDNTWKPSLIAYPQFQAFPSRVQMVKHSSRTVMLIDAMQNLQGPSCTWNNPSYDIEYQNYPDYSAALESIEDANDIEAECGEVSKPAFGISSGKDLCDKPASAVKALDSMVPPRFSSESEQHIPVLHVTPPCRHLFLFSSEVASVDSLGRVSVASVPILDVKNMLYSKSPLARICKLPNCSGQGQSTDSEPVSGNAKVLPDEATAFACLRSRVEDRCSKMEVMLESQPTTPPEIKPVSNVTSPCCLHETSNAVMNHSSPEFLVLNDDDDEELDLSPRLTNFVESGCVPESPINGFPSGDKEDNEIAGMESCALPVPGIKQGAEVTVIRSPCTPMLKAARGSINTEGIYEDVKEVRTPLANLTNSFCSKDWYMSSGEKSVGSRSTNLKRLRRIGDTRSCNGVKENSPKFTRMDYKVPPGRISDIDVRDFIEEEAEVCSDVEVSADEKDDHNEDTFEDSFIDDRIDPTMATQPQDSEVDMMAIYRRSLLSQSPIRRRKNYSNSVTPDSLVSATNLDSCSETENSLHTPQTSTRHNVTNNSSRRNSVCSKLETVAEETMPSTSGNRKRKYSCGELHVPAINLEKQFSSHENDPNWNLYVDDEFYESLDFDALEAQATKLLGEKAGSGVRKESVSEPMQPRVDDLGLPSFDLGI